MRPDVRKRVSVLAAILTAVLCTCGSYVGNVQAMEDTSGAGGYWKAVSPDDVVAFEYHDMILPLDSRFEIGEELGGNQYYVAGDLCTVECMYVADDVNDYSREKYQTLEYDKDGNPIKGPWNGKIENIFWKIYEYSYGDTNFYYTFSAAGDTYYINVFLTGEAAEDRTAAREWFFNLMSETDLTEAGWEKEEMLNNGAVPATEPEPESATEPEPESAAEPKPESAAEPEPESAAEPEPAPAVVPEADEYVPKPLAKTDKKKGQSFFMSTFEEQTGTTPAEFTAADPQPWTIYIIETGEGYTEGNSLVRFENVTEEEMSKDLRYVISDWETQAKYDDADIIYTSDPNRASVILVQNREYVDSGREYGNGFVTAYNCNFTETIYNTKTHESATYQQILEPEYTIRVSGNTYYANRMTLDDAYYNWRGTGLSWLRPD